MRQLRRKERDGRIDVHADVAAHHRRERVCRRAARSVLHSRKARTQVFVWMLVRNLDSTNRLRAEIPPLAPQAIQCGDSARCVAFAKAHGFDSSSFKDVADARWIRRRRNRRPQIVWRRFGSRTR